MLSEEQRISDVKSRVKRWRSSSIIMVAPQAGIHSGIFGCVFDKTNVKIEFSIKFWSISKKKSPKTDCFLPFYGISSEGSLSPYMCQNVKKSSSSYKLLSKTILNFSESLHYLNPKSFWSDGGIGININIVVFKKTRVAGDISATQRAKQTHNNRNISLWRVQWCGMMCCCYSILCLAYPKH